MSGLVQGTRKRYRPLCHDWRRCRRLLRLAVRVRGVVLGEELVEDLARANGELAGLDGRMVHAQHGVDILHRLRAHVRELLDLGRRVLDL